MLFVLVILFFLFWLLNFFSLPGNWLIIVSLIILAFISPSFTPGILWWIGVIGLALLGEVLEWVGQYIGGKKYGLSSKGNLVAIIFGIIGSIIGAPFFLGLGALIGGLMGAYLGGLLWELMNGKSLTNAQRAALGAVFGRLLGLFAKLSAGMGIIFLVLAR